MLMSPTTCTLHFTENSEIVRTSLSAIRHIGQHLWLGCDETATLERLTYRGKKADDHQHFEVADFIDLPASRDEEIDIEGIAYSDRYLWFVGSHSLKRKTYRAEKALDSNLKRLRTIAWEDNRFTLGRIPLVDGQLHKSCPHPENPDITLTAAQLKRRKTGNELTHRLREDPYLGSFLQAGIPGKDNGFDIEGLAVLNETLWLGLRGPVLRGWAVLLELGLEEDEPGELKLRKIGEEKERYVRHFLNLKGLGIRDLCPWGEDLLILAGPTMALDGATRIFSVPLAELQARKTFLQPEVVLEVPYTQGGDRAEGLTLLHPDDPKEILIVYDAPTSKRLSGENAVVGDRFSLSALNPQTVASSPGPDAPPP